MQKGLRDYSGALGPRTDAERVAFALESLCASIDLLGRNLHTPDQSLYATAVVSRYREWRHRQTVAQLVEKGRQPQRGINV
jgi:hypothetical protein